MDRIRIVCFGDSLTWGDDPVTRERIEEENRWTGVLSRLLGDRFQILEEGQNGRTIATDDPAEGEKNGMSYIIPCLESHKPLSLLIVLLGTNDLKQKFSYSAADVAGEMRRFLEKVQSYNTFRLGGTMKVLLVGPPVIGLGGHGSWLDELFCFERACPLSKELPSRYREVAKLTGCSFVDASLFVHSSDVDGVHLDRENQNRLGQVIYDAIREQKLLPLE